jgi:hypothetical protein
VVEALRDRPPVGRRTPVELLVREALDELFRVGAGVPQLAPILGELGVEDARDDACRAHFFLKN